MNTEEAPLYLDAPAPVGAAVEAIEEAEDAVLSADGIEGVVLRYGMFYGPGTLYAKEGGRRSAGEEAALPDNRPRRRHVLLHPRRRRRVRDRGGP